ncbi:hypothetical protein [Roseateles asaccharophilus]|uniref:Uncharacterized protein n=1 Tax=Roseateles asaccharophilus TaxID=582607 RepID=A0ABU2A2M6_9BURK|nr:hypothetical protein [Roseateles asaccharophilus]MDR7331345.1 hypothetical protein [Roseateles asaccharophilus]
MVQGLQIAQLVLFSVLLGILVLGWRRERRTKKLQDALLNELLAGLGPEHRWFRINLASQDFFARRMRMFGFEAKGLLIDEGDGLRIVAVQADGGRIDRRIPKTAGAVRWRGNVGLRSANLHWLEMGVDHDTVMVSADTGMNAIASREATADIIRTLLPQQPLDASALADFALEKHPLALAVTVAALGLLVATLVDLAVTEHLLLQPRSLYWLALLGVPVGLSFYPLLTRRKVPGREAWVLSILLAGALAIAVPAATLRTDQWLSGGPVAMSYKLLDDAQLEPVQPGPPPVSLRNVREYWKQFDVGSIHELDIVRGPLGLWQLDRSRLNSLTRDWYRRQDEQPKAAGSSPVGGASAPPP